ncbi:PAAR motif of membrane proteins [Serratia phage 92A1]|nr:PAAR motif of membrane proteins [Serratia phage 92A1]
MSGLSFDKALTAGHDAYPPTQVNSTQAKTFVQGIPALVEGDPITPHTKMTKPYDTHGGEAIASTSKVFIGGKKAIMMADPISCGDTVAQSSSKVFIK